MDAAEGALEFDADRSGGGLGSMVSCRGAAQVLSMLERRTPKVVARTSDRCDVQLGKVGDTLLLCGSLMVEVRSRKAQRVAGNDQ
jgi:hypothetical protein